MVYDEGTYVLVRLCFFGLVLITLGRKKFLPKGCDSLTLLTMERVLQSVCDLNNC
jgi:hypothetical protein